MDIMEIHKTLSALLDKLKRNRELVSLAELKTNTASPIQRYVRKYAQQPLPMSKKAALQGIRIRKAYFKEALPIIENAIHRSGLLAKDFSRGLQTAGYQGN